MNKVWLRVERARQSMHRYIGERDKYYLRYDMRKMAAMRKEGRTFTDIAPHFGVSKSTVRVLLLKWDEDNGRLKQSSG